MHVDHQVTSLVTALIILHFPVSKSHGDPHYRGLMAYEP